jgi:hypothetical protein
VIALWYRDGALDEIAVPMTGMDTIRRHASDRTLPDGVRVWTETPRPVRGLLLYLPEGESVEARHLADVEGWLARMVSRKPLDCLPSIDHDG